MRHFLFIIIAILLCVGCRSSRQETSSSLTNIQLEEMISQRLLQFRTGSKITDTRRQDSMTVVITEYNAPDSTGHQSKKTQTVISSGSQTTTTENEAESTTTVSADTTSRKKDIQQSDIQTLKAVPLPWYSGFEPYIVLAIIAVVLYLLKRLDLIKL